MPAHIKVRNEYSEWASEKQIAFILRLVEEREMSAEQVEWTLAKVRDHEGRKKLISKVLARRIIGQRNSAGEYINGLLSLPLKPGMHKEHFLALVKAPAGTTRPTAEDITARTGLTPLEDVPEIVVPRRNQVPAKVGIYRRDDGNVYVVRKARGSDRVYSLRLVESPPRLAANGETVHHDFVKDFRMTWVLTENERITDDAEIAALSIQVGACVMCGHAIWQAKSVRRMMGTRCYKRVHGLPIR